MLKGVPNLFGNVTPGRAVLDIKSGHTVYKTRFSCSDNAIDLDAIEPSEKATFDAKREVYVLSEKASMAIRDAILATPGYRGLIL